MRIHSKNDRKATGLSADILRALLAARPEPEKLRQGPLLGQTFELFLIEQGQLLFAPCGIKGKPQDRTLSRVFLLEEQSEACLKQYLDCPQTDFLALALPRHDRVLLLSALPGLGKGRAVAAVVHIGAHSVSRVLRYSFEQSVTMDEAVAQMGSGHLRETDELTYQFLQRLLHSWRCYLGGVHTGEGWQDVEERRELSLLLQSMVEQLLAFVGERVSPALLTTFPVFYPFRGQWNAGRAAWMLLAAYCGLYRRYGRAVVEQVHVLTDNERLLPMFGFSAGNRAKLPQEFSYCLMLSEEWEFFFDVRRKSNTVLVRLCPMKQLPVRRPIVLSAGGMGEASLYQEVKLEKFIPPRPIGE